VPDHAGDEELRRARIGRKDVVDGELGIPTATIDSHLQRFFSPHPVLPPALSHFPRVLASLALSLALGIAVAGTPEPRPPSCIDRQPASDRPAGVPPQVSELSYRCELLRSGTRVWLGETGEEHESTVLLVHGLGHSAHRDWRGVIAALSQRFHVITLDLPGFGASPALPGGYSFTALSNVLDEVLALAAPGRRVHVVGHSLGAAVSLHFAHQHAERVDRLVLVDAAGVLLNTVFARNFAQLDTPDVGVAGVDKLLRRMDARINGLSKAIFGGLDRSFDFSRWLARHPSVRNTLFGKYTQVEAALGLVEHDFSPEIRQVRAPTTLIWGRDDRVAPLRTGELLAARLPDARLHVLDGVGHVPMNQKPELFMPLLLQALDGPLLPRSAAVLPDNEEGELHCLNQPGRRYSGRIRHLRLENCQGARLADAELGQLTLVNSSITLDRVSIHSDDVALDAHRSQVTGTVVQIKGRVAIRADNSGLDLAGASLRASERAVELRNGSRLYFSVSDIQAPDHTGDAHFIWPPDAPP
jgi:pimeloyl-ACP methyl ester carboxylesterase